MRRVVLTVQAAALRVRQGGPRSGALAPRLQGRAQHQSASKDGQDAAEEAGSWLRVRVLAVLNISAGYPPHRGRRRPLAAPRPPGPRP